MASRATARREARQRHNREHFATYSEGQITPDIRLTIMLVLVARRWRSLLDEKLRPLDQSSARMEALSAIFNTPGPRAQVDIAKRLRIEGPTLTRMIDTLEKDALVERLPDPADRRTKHLRLTDEGENSLDDVLTVADTYRAQLLADVSEDEKRMLIDILGRMLARLDGGLADAEAPAGA